MVLFTVKQLFELKKIYFRDTSDTKLILHMKFNQGTLIVLIARHEELLFWEPIKDIVEGEDLTSHILTSFGETQGLRDSKEINKLMLDRQIWTKNYFCLDVGAALSRVESRIVLILQNRNILSV